MHLNKFFDSVRIASAQVGFGLAAPRRPLFRRSAASTQPAVLARRRARRNTMMLGALVAILTLGAVFWPPRHGAVIVVMPPWIETADAERRIQAAGGVVFAPSDGDVRLLGLSVARTAIGAHPGFMSRLFWSGGLAFSAQPLFWLEDQIEGASAWARGPDAL